MGAFVLVLALVAPQDSLWSYIMRCAVEGAHLEGCVLSDLACSFDQHLQGTCGAPTPDPEPPPSELTAPTGLVDTGTTITAAHSGRLTDWYTLQLDGVYHAHVGMEGFADGTVTLPLGTLDPGVYQATVLACSDAAGCVTSAPLEIRR